MAWYAAPTLSEPNSPKFRPIDLAMTLHNARLNQGRAVPHASAMRSINVQNGQPDAPIETYKMGLAKEVEDFLEETRLRVNPQAPSRLACFFVSADRESAELRSSELRNNRKIYPCRVLLDGNVYVADIRTFDKLMNNPCSGVLAEQYWTSMDDLGSIDKSYREILVGGSLYFPDWESFPSINLEAASQYLSLREFCLENGYSLDGWQKASKA